MWIAGGRGSELRTMLWESTGPANNMMVETDKDCSHFFFINLYNKWEALKDNAHQN